MTRRLRASAVAHRSTRRRPLAAVAALVAILAGLVPAGTTQAAPDPMTCTGYPEPRVFIESQDWWSPIPGIGGLGHIHMGMCWPVAETVSGRVRFDMRIVFHGNKGRLNLIKLQDDRSFTLMRVFPGYTPPDATDTTYWRTFYVDTRRMPDGGRLMRWYARLRHVNGNEEYARAAWILDVENGKTDYNRVRWGQYTGSGWYKEARARVGWGYQTSSIKSGIPRLPVRGIWRPKVSFSCNGCRPMSYWFATVDPDFHKGHRGWMVKTGGGHWSGNLAIDTTRLSNGTHKLVLVSASKRVFPERRHMGVFAIPFTVRN
jgi:hypothetical protein